MRRIPEPQELMDEPTQAAAYAQADFSEPNVDLFRPTTLEEAQHIVDTYAGEEPTVLRNDFYNSLLAAFHCEEIVQQLARARLDQLEVNITTDRHLVVSGYCGDNVPRLPKESITSAVER